MESLFGITGSKVLLTGGTGGIGSALVEGFLRAGAHVCVLARDEDAVKISQQKYSEFGGNLTYVIADFLSDDSCLSAVAQATKALGQIDTLVLAHGNAMPGPAIDLTLDRRRFK